MISKSSLNVRFWHKADIQTHSNNVCGGALRRRDFITGIAGSSVAWPLAAHAEVSTKRPVIAVLSAITKEGNSPLNAFVQGLKELGYVDGVNVDIVYRYAEEHLDRFPLLAAQVVELKPDVILATVTPLLWRRER